MLAQKNPQAYKNLNTSYVDIKRKHRHICVIFLLHLNTSYVDIKQPNKEANSLQQKYLNTSYVDIKP